MSQADDVVIVMRHAENANYAVGLATMSCEETFIRGWAHRMKRRDWALSLGFWTTELAPRCLRTRCWIQKQLNFVNLPNQSKWSELLTSTRRIHVVLCYSTTGMTPLYFVLWLLISFSIGNKSPVEDAGYVYIHTISHIGITYALYNEGLKALSSRGCDCYPFTL